MFCEIERLERLIKGMQLDGFGSNGSFNKYFLSINFGLNTLRVRENKNGTHSVCVSQNTK
jgi:hypothetical protein